MYKEWFIQRYSDIHSDLNKLENEIEEHLKAGRSKKKNYRNYRSFK
jgi:hypothetical protein